MSVGLHVARWSAMAQSVRHSWRTVAPCFAHPWFAFLRGLGARANDRWER
jgi:hypothetical protein